MRAESKSQLVKFAAFAALGIAGLLTIDEFTDNDRGGSVGGSINEVVEEIGDEIDDNTIGR